jgi:hypothetical protein
MKLTPKYHLWIHMVQRISDFIHMENYMVLESHFASGIIEISRVAVGGVGGLVVVVVCVYVVCVYVVGEGVSVCVVVVWCVCVCLGCVGCVWWEGYGGWGRLNEMVR